MLTNLSRILSNSWKNFYRNLWVSLATLSIIIIAVSIVGFLILFNVSSRTLAQEARDNIDLPVYWDANTPEEYILNIKSQLEERVEVKEVSYTSREQALKEISEDEKDNEVIQSSIDAVGDNPFSAHLNIKVYDVDNFDSIIDFVRNLDEESFIDDLRDTEYSELEETINWINDIAGDVTIGGIIFSIIFGIFVFFVSYNTIRLSIYSASEEIHIMKLVGASNWFIRGPFFITGLFYGIFSSIVVLAMFWFLTDWLGHEINLIFDYFNLYEYFMENILLIYSMLLASGIVLGALSSYVAVRRYLGV